MTTADPSGPDHGRALDELRDLADETVTVDTDGNPSADNRPKHEMPDGVEGPGSDHVQQQPGGGSAEPRHLVDTDHRSQMADGSTPNGWFAGPHSDPDRFELLGSGLAGGEGNTWRGRYRGELTAPLTLAVKELRRPPHAPAEWPAPADLRRWNDQRALLQYMRIDHLVTVIDIFVGSAPHLAGSARAAASDTPYVVMEWVPGPTLADELSGVPASAESLDGRLAHVQHVAEALHSLHSKTASAGNPTLHRDVKPTNCILDPRRGVVLVDVGTMRRMDDGYDHAGFHTPAYTAPEVLANPQAARAASSDLYSLGALAYFCVVGEDPPVSDQPGAAEQIRTRLLAATRAAGVAQPQAFADHLRLMLDPAPHERPSDSMSWSRRLRSLAAVRRRASPAGWLRPGRSWTGARAGTVAAVLAVVAFLAVAFIPWSQTEPAPGNPGPSEAESLQAGPPPRPGPGGGGPPGAPPNEPLPSAAPTDAEGLVRSRYATIVAPAHDRPSPLCTIIEGTAKLPTGQTILTSVENMEIGDGVRHLQLVTGWEQPTNLSSWKGRQFMGLPGEPAGGRFRVEVIMASLAGLKQQVAAAGGEQGTWRSQFPPGSQVVASVIVTRAEDGAQDPECGPP